MEDVSDFATSIRAISSFFSLDTSFAISALASANDFAFFEASSEDFEKRYNADVNATRYGASLFPIKKP